MHTHENEDKVRVGALFVWRMFHQHDVYAADQPNRYLKLQVWTNKPHKMCLSTSEHTTYFHEITTTGVHFASDFLGLHVYVN
jgi:hypothetical protein